MSNLKENETEYDYNLGQGRNVRQLDGNCNTNAWIISVIIVICLVVIAYKALKPLFL